MRYRQGFLRLLNPPACGRSKRSDDTEWSSCCSQIIAVWLTAGKWIADKGLPGRKYLTIKESCLLLFDNRAVNKTIIVGNKLPT